MTVADAPGFVIASRWRGWVTLLPCGGEDGGPVAEKEELTLIPHAAGSLALPAVSLALEDLGASGSVSCCVTGAGSGVMVRPAVELELIRERGRG